MKEHKTALELAKGKGKANMKTALELAKKLIAGEWLCHWDEMLRYHEKQFLVYDWDCEGNPVINTFSRKEIFRQLRAGMWAD